MFARRSAQGVPVLLRRFVALALCLLSSCGGGGGGGGGAVPDAPSGVAASAAPGEVVITWTAVSGATSYNLYLASQSGVDPTNWSTLPDGRHVVGAVSPCHVTGLSNGVAFYFVVTARNGAGESAASAQVSATPMEVPISPTGLTARVQASQVTLRWDPVAGASSYRIYWANESGVTAANYANLPGGDRVDGVDSPHLVDGLVNQKVYYFVVTACNAAGESTESLQLAATPLASGWFWQAPYPTGEKLTRVDFVDAVTGWVVGASGTILHTANGGTTWAAQTSETDSTLVDVHFVDAMSGWAVGGGGTFWAPYGTILHTANGGLDWALQAPGIVPILSGVSFVDAQNGWAVGDAGTILHTSDGGRRWTKLAGPTTQPLWKVEFVDALNGYVVGGNGADGVVLKTVDGGANWSVYWVLGAQITDLSFPNVQRGFALDASGRVFGTTNGGSSWGALPIPTSAILGGMHFADTQAGWIVGSSGTLLHTINGGGSWDQQAGGTDKFLNSVESVGTQEAWVVGDQGLILHTTDGGADWQRQSNPLWSSGEAFTDASFVDSSQGWIVSHSILHTMDGGATWAAQLASTPDLLWGVDFVDAQNGWVVGDGSQILHTTDGGASWTPQDGNGASQLWDVDFVDTNFGVAVGPRGIIRTTTDGGENWIPRSSGTLSDLGGVCVVDSQHAWAVGTGGVILRTTNGGQTWLGQISGTLSDLRAVAAVDADTAWAVGGNSSDPPITRTIDGGNTWYVQSFPTSPGFGWFHDVTFSDASHGWAVGSGGLICGTNDGGIHWLRQNSASSVDFWAVRAASSTTAWAVGVGLLKTTTGGW